MDVADDQPTGFRLNIDVNLKRYTIHNDGLLFSGQQRAALTLALKDLAARLPCHISHVGVGKVSGQIDGFDEVATCTVWVSDHQLLDALLSRRQHLVRDTTGV